MENPYKHFADFFVRKKQDSVLLFYGDSGSRTHDLQIANLSLYQLSYIPRFGGNIELASAIVKS